MGGNLPVPDEEPDKGRERREDEQVIQQPREPEFQSEEEELEYWKSLGYSEEAAQEIMKARSQGVDIRSPEDVERKWGEHQRILEERFRQRVERESGGWLTAEFRPWWQVEEEIRALPGGEEFLAELFKQTGGGWRYMDLLAHLNVEKVREELFKLQRHSEVVVKGGEFEGKFYLPGGIEVPKEVYESWVKGQLAGTGTFTDIGTLQQLTGRSGVVDWGLVNLAKQISPLSTFLETFAKGFVETVTLGIISPPTPQWDTARLAFKQLGIMPELGRGTRIELPLPSDVQKVADTIGASVLSGGLGYAIGTVSAMHTPELVAKFAGYLPGGSIKLPSGESVKVPSLAERLRLEAELHFPRLTRFLEGAGLLTKGEFKVEKGVLRFAPEKIPHIPSVVDVVAQRVEAPRLEAGRLYVRYSDWVPAPQGVEAFRLKPGELGFLPTKEGIRVPVTEGSWGFAGVRSGELSWFFGVGTPEGSAFKALRFGPLEIRMPSFSTVIRRLNVDVAKLVEYAKMGGGLPARSVAEIISGGAPLAFRPAVPVRYLAVPRAPVIPLPPLLLPRSKEELPLPFRVPVVSKEREKEELRIPVLGKPWERREPIPAPPRPRAEEVVKTAVRAVQPAVRPVPREASVPVSVSVPASTTVQRQTVRVSPAQPKPPALKPPAAPPLPPLHPPGSSPGTRWKQAGRKGEAVSRQWFFLGRWVREGVVPGTLPVPKGKKRKGKKRVKKR